MTDVEAMAISKILPAAAQLKAHGSDLLPAALPLHHLEGFQGSSGPNALRPKGAADERTLGRFHHRAATNRGSDGIAIAQGYQTWPYPARHHI